jgi:GGDEF domain-containing protein
VTGLDINGRRLARIQAEQKAEWVTSAAFTDANTGLANRSALEQKVLDSIAAVDGPDSFALLYIDIANYREMSLGYDARSLEQVVHFVADKLKNCLSGGVFLARYSSSSFMVLVNNPESGEHQFMYSRLRQLQGLKTEGGQALLWRAGQAVYPDSGHSSRRLIRAAMVSQALAAIGSFNNLAQDPNLIRTGS